MLLLHAQYFGFAGRQKKMCPCMEAALSPFYNIGCLRKVLVPAPHRSPRDAVSPRGGCLTRSAAGEQAAGRAEFGLLQTAFTWD